MKHSDIEPFDGACADHRASVSALAHELRQPLANLSCAAAVLQRESLSPVALATVAIFQRQVRQMSRMVEDLFDDARCAKRTVSLRLRSIDLRATVEEFAQDVRARVIQQGHEFVVVTGDRPLWVEADSGRIRQVLSNLIDNAIKFTERGGRIEVRAAQSGRQVVLEIRDTGHGFEPAQLTRMVGRVGQVRSTNGPGRGIGLTIVRDIVMLHGGTVEAHSDGIGHGADFTVSLPSQDAGGEAEQVMLRPESSTGAIGHPPASERAIASPGSRPVPLVTIPLAGIPFEEIERQAVIEALRMSNWVQKGAAKLLRISPRVMHYKIKVLGIEIPRGAGVTTAGGAAATVNAGRDRTLRLTDAVWRPQEVQR